MRIKLRRFGWLITGGILLLAIGCGSAAPAARPSLDAPTQTPNIPATEAAKGPAVPVRIPTATPVPPEVSQTAKKFASGYLVVNEEWDELHRYFDKWRLRVYACRSVTRVPRSGGAKMCRCVDVYKRPREGVNVRRGRRSDAEIKCFFGPPS